MPGHKVLRGIAVIPLLLPCTCSMPDRAPASQAAAVQPQGLILGASEGERRVRRPKAADVAGLADPFILKVDRLNGGSPDLVMGYEDISPC